MRTATARRWLRDSRGPAAAAVAGAIARAVGLRGGRAWRGSGRLGAGDARGARRARGALHRRRAAAGRASGCASQRGHCRARAPSQARRCCQAPGTGCDRLAGGRALRPYSKPISRWHAAGAHRMPPAGSGGAGARARFRLRAHRRRRPARRRLQPRAGAPRPHRSPRQRRAPTAPPHAPPASGSCWARVHGSGYPARASRHTGAGLGMQHSLDRSSTGGLTDWG
jgi:hypothetical protein